MSSLAVSGIAPFLDFADIDAKHNSDLSTRDTMFNEILANRDAQLTTELADRDARFQRSKEALKCLILLLQNSVIEQVLQTYHNNFGRVATEFESINGGISTLQNEINRYYAVVQARSDISPEIRIEPIEDANQSEALPVRPDDHFRIYLQKSFFLSCSEKDK
ncbi:12789_t:CDS:2 [Ambispora gerdemannii]|uniref:12789_t:CDS:1 n=1 Tax=Ambispora gerdemannii TaxID=144530 RepID=A0A9N9DTU5_9GLOM|nr:12789_t:CDS:2 [Ambispora gerdemannii]